MLCVGGPRHGENVECEKSWFEVPVPIRRSYFNDLDISEPHYQVIRYERQELITKSGKRIPVWIVE